MITEQHINPRTATYPLNLTDDQRLKLCVWFSGATLFKCDGKPFTWYYYDPTNLENRFGYVCNKTGKVLMGDKRIIDGLLGQRSLMLKEFLDKYLKEASN